MFYNLKFMLFCVTVVVSYQHFSEAKKCKFCHLKKARENRLFAVGGQILSKLGFFSPPKTGYSGSDNVTQYKAMELFKTIVQQRHKETTDALILQQENDKDYFAKEIIQLSLLDASRRGTDDTQSFILTFNASQLQDEKTQIKVVRADLRLYISEKIKETCKSKIQVCDEYFKEGKSNTENGIQRICESSQSEKYFEGSSVGWKVFDATRAVHSWSVRSSTKLKIAVSCADKDKSEKSFAKNKAASKTITNGAYLLRDSYHQPTVIVWTQRQNEQSRKRQKRSLDMKFCKKKKKTKKCCLRKLYIDFQKDLNWRWIHAPAGFYANYCSGKCPFLWSSENHHSTIMGLYNSLNKSAPGDPCCVAKSYEPLVILYFDDNRKPKIEELSNMSVRECVCL